ncbi:hypothetical protein [Neobacillus cucumis]
MPLDMQAKLLRVIDNNEVQRHGIVQNVLNNCSLSRRRTRIYRKW